MKARLRSTGPVLRGTTTACTCFRWPQRDSLKNVVSDDWLNIVLYDRFVQDRSEAYLGPMEPGLVGPEFLRQEAKSVEVCGHRVGERQSVF